MFLVKDRANPHFEHQQPLMELIVESDGMLTQFQHLADDSGRVIRYSFSYMQDLMLAGFRQDGRGSPDHTNDMLRSSIGEVSNKE
jgi:hypothetical protein